VDFLRKRSLEQKKPAYKPLVVYVLRKLKPLNLQKKQAKNHLEKKLGKENKPQLKNQVDPGLVRGVKKNHRLPRQVLPPVIGLDLFPIRVFRVGRFGQPIWL
jgi:hypothetical protein